MSEKHKKIQQNEFSGSLTRESIDAHDEQFEVVNGKYTNGETKQTLRVGYVPGSPDSDLTILRAMPWSEHPERPFERGRNAAASLLTDAEVFTVSSPGIGKGSAELNHAQAKELTAPGYLSHRYGRPDFGAERTSFSSIGRACQEALYDGINQLKGADYLDNRIIALDLYSQGASTGAGMMEWLQHSPDLVIWREMPDYMTDVPLMEFGKNFMDHGADDFDVYAKENQHLQGGRHDSLLGGTLRMLRDPMQNIRYVRGMAGGSITPDLYGAHSVDKLSPETLHVVINGENSHVSSTERNDMLSEHLQAKTGSAVVRMVVEDGTHPMANQYELNGGMLNQAIDLIRQ